MTPDLPLRGWTITARLVTLALVPATIMFLAVNAWLYSTARQEAAADIRERGRLIAAALSEGSRYGVISGNKQSVEQTVNGLMVADPSVVRIEILDALGLKLVDVSREGNTDVQQTFEMPIGTGALDVNLFDVRPSPTTAVNAAAIGRVRVAMSPTPILQAKRERLYFSSAMVLLAAVFSAVLGLALARRLREPLKAVMAALRGIRRGRYDLHLDHRIGGELGELQSTIVDMAKDLQVTHRELEAKVALRTDELKQAMNLALEADAEKRRLITQGNERVEEERRRISLEIHDDLNALLVAIRLQVGTMAGRARDAKEPEMIRSADRIAELIDNVYARSREIVQRLRPEIIDTLGLEGAIEEMVRHLDEADQSCRYGFAQEDALPLLSEGVAIAGYRVVQEALSNVVKHASASTCTVTVRALGEPAGIQVTIRDNGIGFDTEARYTGLGLIGMRERVAALRGSLLIESSAGQGTSVTMILSVP